MFTPSRLAHALARRLTSIGAIVAIVAQLSVALAPLGEAQEGGSMAAHVELGGTSTHYAHNDATCAVCQARSLQGLTPRAPAPPPASSFQAMELVAVAERFLSPELLSHNTPRAPPSRI